MFSINIQSFSSIFSRKNLIRFVVMIPILISLIMNCTVFRAMLYHRGEEKPQLATYEDYLITGDTKVQEQRSEIYNHPWRYSNTLVRAAMTNDEIVKFVLNYPTYKDLAQTEEIDITNIPKRGIYPLFIQYDERWGYSKYGDDVLGLSGCAPTAMAMVISGLKNDNSINPKVLAEYGEKHDFYVDGVGTNWKFVASVAKHYGLKATESHVLPDIIRANLKKKYPIIITVGPGTFTSTGHFFLLTDIDNDDNVSIIDPYSKIRTDLAWDLDIIVKEGASIWTITK